MSEPHRPKRARDSLERDRMSRALSLALDHPDRVREAIEQDVQSLHAFVWWLRARTCKVCKRRLKPHQEKYCSLVCARRKAAWRREGREPERRKRGEFFRSVTQPVAIIDVADRLGLTVEEARRRAAVDVRRGRLLAATKNGVIDFVGRPPVGEPPPIERPPRGNVERKLREQQRVRNRRRRSAYRARRRARAKSSSEAES